MNKEIPPNKAQQSQTVYQSYKALDLIFPYQSIMQTLFIWQWSLVHYCISCITFAQRKRIYWLHHFLQLATSNSNIGTLNLPTWKQH